MLCGWEGNRRPGGKYWQPTAGWMTYAVATLGVFYDRNAACITVVRYAN